MRTVLVIDDNPRRDHGAGSAAVAQRNGSLTARSPDEGLEILRRERVDLVIADMNFHEDTTSGDEGVGLFRAIRAAHLTCR